MVHAADRSPRSRDCRNAPNVALVSTLLAEFRSLYKKVMPSGYRTISSRERMERRHAGLPQVRNGALGLGMAVKYGGNQILVHHQSSLSAVRATEALHRKRLDRDVRSAERGLTVHRASLHA